MGSEMCIRDRLNSVTLPGKIDLPGGLLNDSIPVKFVFVSSMKSQKMQKRLLFT